LGVFIPNIGVVPKLLIPNSIPLNFIELLNIMFDVFKLLVVILLATVILGAVILLDIVRLCAVILLDIVRLGAVINVEAYRLDV